MHICVPHHRTALSQSIIGMREAPPMKVAIVHEWLVSYAGSERVLEQMISCLPNADVFTLIDALPAGERGFLGGRPVYTSFLQKLPGAQKHHRSFLPFMPLAIEQLDVSDYDLVISSSHAVAKGVLTGPDQLHICMCYSPIRYAWDMQHQYLKEAGLDKGIKSWLVRWLLHKIRIWDSRTALGVDHFVAISHFIGRRIAKVYRRSSDVIYPPVNLESFPVHAYKDGFYLAASRMVPYKKMPMIVEAFARIPGRRLVVIGDGPELEKCRALAAPNVQILGYQPDAVLRDHMQRAKGFVFAAEEDFGIAPLEAQACGTPVIAFGKGGALETVRGQKAERPTGVFFEEQTVDALCEAVERFEALAPGVITPEACRQNAERFSVARFRKEFSELVSTKWDAFHGNRQGI
jgi:glycosyltransferase involved in cell wall biosynthesis